MRRLLVIVCVLALAACAVPRPREDTPPSTVPVGEAEVLRVLERYREVRATAAELLDAKPLSTVESDGVLDIDTGSFEVAQRLRKASGGTDPAAIDLQQLAAPRFTSYPLWFVAEVRDRSDDVNRVQVFQRTSAVDPWLLVASPETVLSTRLPELRRRDGVPLAVAADSAAGMSMSPQQVADAYAAVLDDPDAEQAAALEDDDFLQQMRETAERNAGLDGVDFSQSWSAEDVTHALRTSDGGALVFVDLERIDTYEVGDGVRVTWPQNSPQQALLESGVSTRASLRYLHQVLVLVPGGDEKPRALGQYGGVVGLVDENDGNDEKDD